MWKVEVENSWIDHQLHNPTQGMVRFNSFLLVTVLISSALLTLFFYLSLSLSILLISSFKMKPIRTKKISLKHKIFIYLNFLINNWTETKEYYFSHTPAVWTVIPPWDSGIGSPGRPSSVSHSPVAVWPQPVVDWACPPHPLDPVRRDN